MVKLLYPPFLDGIIMLSPPRSGPNILLLIRISPDALFHLKRRLGSLISLTFFGKEDIKLDAPNRMSNRENNKESLFINGVYVTWV
jgi:hypothetical protein